MALVTLSIPDELFAKYGSYNPDQPENAMVATLKRFKDVPTGKPALVLAAEDLTALQKLKAGLSLETPLQLLSWVKGLVEFNIGGSKFSLSEAQLKRLATTAQFWKKDYKKALEETIKAGLVRELGV